MKLCLVAATVAATVSLTTPVSAADINISIFMGQPIYMRVPPGHAKHWD